MSPETVDSLLKNYKTNIGRKGHLQTEVSFLKREIEKAKKTMVDQVALHGQVYSDMPHGSDVGQPTERMAIKFADGYVTPHVQQMLDELQQNENELDTVSRYVIYVDAWLSGLTEKERLILWNQVIQAMTWRQVAIKYHEKYGYEYSKDTMKTIKNSALSKVYKFAE